jgi:hypothetical protein
VEDQELSREPQPVKNGALPGSLAARLQERRVEREQRTTELFEPPGFEDMFKIEMQVVGFKRLADIVLAHQRQRDEALRALYSAADQVLAATVAFHVVRDDGSTELGESLTWNTLASAFDPTLTAETRPRVALIRLLDATGVMELFAEWNEWNSHGNGSVDKGLSADFPVTG